MNTELANRQQTNGNGKHLQVAPPVDVFENDDEFRIVTDVPGASADTITVRLDKDQLFIYARETGDLPAVVAAEYSRTFVVPPGIDAKAITAELKDGVLSIRLPKSEVARPRTIQVRAS